MGFNDHIDFDLHEAIQDLLAEGMLEEGTPAYGIAQQVTQTGYDSLNGDLVGHLSDARGEEKRLDKTTDRLFPEG